MAYVALWILWLVSYFYFIIKIYYSDFGLDIRKAYGLCHTMDIMAS